MRLRTIVLFIALSAQVFVLIGDVSWVSAIPLVITAPEAGPADEHFREGLTLLGKGDSKGAQAVFQKMLDADPKHVGALTGLAEALVQQGHYQEAGERIQQALAVQPRNGALHRSWGRYLVGRKELKKAEEAFRKAIQLSPKDASALVDLGNLHLGEFKHPDQAAKAFASAVKLDPDNANAHFGLGASYAMLKKTTEAFNELETVVRLNPNNLAANMALGNLYQEQKDYDRARLAYDAALKIEPKFTDAAMAKGDVLALKGRFEEASQSYKTVIVNAPSQPLAYNNLAWIAAEEKARLDEAVSWAKKAIELGPSVPQFQDTLAWVYRAKGELGQAAETLTAALKMNEKEPTVLYHLGIVLSEQGKTSEAITALKKTVKLHPDAGIVKDAEQRINVLSSAHTSR